MLFRSEGILESELGRQGAELAAVNAQFDPNKQVSDIQTLIQQDVDALIVYPVSPEAVQGVLKEAQDKGIPVIVEDTKFGGPYTTNVTADVETAASEGAKLMKELVGDKEVGVIVGPPFTEFLKRSGDTFEKVAKEEGLNIVDTKTNTAVDPDGAKTIADAWKQQYPDMAGIWTFNDNSAVGVASTFDDDWAPTVVSINGQPNVMPLIEEGVVNTTYDLRQDMAARALAFASTSAICGEELPEDIWFESRAVNEENVGDWVDPTERGKEEVEVELVEKDGRWVLTETGN